MSCHPKHLLQLVGLGTTWEPCCLYPACCAPTCCSCCHLTCSLSGSRLSKEGSAVYAAAACAGCRPGSALSAAALAASVSGLLFKSEGLRRNIWPTTDMGS
jgi:hypothetical protein